MEQESGGTNSGGSSYAETNCAQTRKLFSPYLDGRVSGSEMHALRLHLDQCANCSRKYAAMERTQELLANLGSKKAPPDLALKLRLAIARGRLEARLR